MSTWLSSPASCSFHFFLPLSLAFPSLDINRNPLSRGSVNIRNYRVLTPFIMCLQSHSYLLWVLHVGEVPCYLRWQRTGSNYKPLISLRKRVSWADLCRSSLHICVILATVLLQIITVDFFLYFIPTRLPIPQVKKALAVEWSGMSPKSLGI